MPARQVYFSILVFLEGFELVDTVQTSKIADFCPETKFPCLNIVAKLLPSRPPQIGPQHSYLQDPRQGLVHVPERACSVDAIQVSGQGIAELVFKGLDICDFGGPANSGGPGNHSKIEQGQKGQKKKEETKESKSSKKKG